MRNPARRYTKEQLAFEVWARDEDGHFSYNPWFGDWNDAFEAAAQKVEQDASVGIFTTASVIDHSDEQCPRPTLRITPADLEEGKNGYFRINRLQVMRKYLSFEGQF